MKDVEVASSDSHLTFLLLGRNFCSTGVVLAVVVYGVRTDAERRRIKKVGESGRLPDGRTTGGTHNRVLGRESCGQKQGQEDSFSDRQSSTDDRTTN